MDLPIMVPSIILLLFQYLSGTLLAIPCHSEPDNSFGSPRHSVPFFRSCGPRPRSGVPPKPTDFRLARRRSGRVSTSQCGAMYCACSRRSLSHRRRRSSRRRLLCMRNSNSKNPGASSAFESGTHFEPQRSFFRLTGYSQILRRIH